MTMLTPKSQIYLVFMSMFCQTLRALPLDEKTKVIESAIRLLKEESKVVEDSK